MVDRVQRRVLDGMGLIVLHSGHFSKIFKRLMGTTCNLKWREAGEHERIWVVDPGHPIAEGLGESFVHRRRGDVRRAFRYPGAGSSWSWSAGSRAARCSGAAAATSAAAARSSTSARPRDLSDLLQPGRPAGDRQRRRWASQPVGAAPTFGNRSPRGAAGRFSDAWALGLAARRRVSVLTAGRTWCRSPITA